MLLGTAALEALQRARVAVFGIGGVGGYAVEVLARSGVGSIDLIDNDTVCPTNINRQIIALHSTVGQEKVEVARLRVLDINPECRVGVHKMFYLPENAHEIDLQKYDYVLDCIDTIKAKIDLVMRCHALNIPIISSMGAANKVDATAWRVADISLTTVDPIAKIMRKKLRKQGIDHLKVVFSEEQPLVAAEPLLPSSEPIPPFSDVQNTSTADATPFFSGIKNSSLINTAQSIVNSAQPLGETKTPTSANHSLNISPSKTCRPTPASNAFIPAVAGIILGAEVVKDIIAAFKSPN